MNIDTLRATEAHVFWMGLIEKYKENFGLKLADDGKFLAPDLEALFLSAWLEDHHDVASAMSFVRRYLAVSGIEDRHEAKFIRQLFLDTMQSKDPADELETLCLLVSLWAGFNNLAQTTIRVKSNTK